MFGGVEVIHREWNPIFWRFWRSERESFLPRSKRLYLSKLQLSSRKKYCFEEIFGIREEI